ncbi:NAD(P)-dependent oxidoreductase, partial [Vibrio diabolicus]
MEKQRVAFIGLGVMGYPMAGYLSKAGYETKVYNRTKAKADKWAEESNGIACETPREAAEGCDIVFTCVGNDDDVRSVVYGEEGILVGLKAGEVLVDHTTTSADLAVELADACTKYGNHFIDAPVSGGQAGAENGVLTIMCGGGQD